MTGFGFGLSSPTAGLAFSVMMIEMMKYYIGGTNSGIST